MEMIEFTLSESLDEIDMLYIYHRLRRFFKPTEIMNSVVDYADEKDIKEGSDEMKILEMIYEKADQEIPFDDAHKRDLLIKDFAPFYDRIGTIALHLSLAFFVLEILSYFKPIDLGSEVANYFKILALDHVGNADNSLYLALPLVMMQNIEYALFREEINFSRLLFLKKAIEKLVEIGKAFLPYALVTIILAYQIDTETAQILPGSFGTPDIYDLPVGLVSVIGLAKALEMHRYGRPFYRPFLDKLIKVQIKHKIVLLLVVLMTTFLPEGPLRSSTIKSNSDEEPSVNTPLNFLRRVFNGSKK